MPPQRFAAHQTTEWLSEPVNFAADRTSRSPVIIQSLARAIVKRQTRRAFDPDELNSRIAMLCRACHKFIHRTLTECELAASYNTIFQLRSQPGIAKFINWIASKPSGLAVHSARARR